MEKRLSTTSESSSIDGSMDIDHKQTNDLVAANDTSANIKILSKSDATVKLVGFESSDRETRETRRRSRNHNENDTVTSNDADQSEDNVEANTDPSNAHGTIVRRENLRQLENSMISLRKSFRFADRVPPNINNNNNNNLKSNNHSKRSQRIGSNENSDGSNDNGKTSQYSCPICGVCSATQHDFTEHIRGHNNSDGSHNYTCQICFKVVSSASSLDRHVLVHTGERPFTCKFCHVTFTTNGNMHRHMRTHKHRDGLINKGTVSGGANTNNTSNNTNNTNNESSSKSSNRSSEGLYESEGSNDSNASGSGNDGKRKNTEDVYSVGVKRRLKTLNNNNNVINNNSIEVNSQPQRFCCPVCVRNDFLTMAGLENHVDTEHPSIQAKCRCCEVVFKSYKALNAHKCSAENKPPHITQGFKDLTFVDFSSEKFPLIAKVMCEQSIRTPITSQKYECQKCYRAFPCSSALDIHTAKCAGSESKHLISLRKRMLSETSDEADTRRRDDFFAHLDLKNKNDSNPNEFYQSTEYDSDTDGIEHKKLRKDDWYSSMSKCSNGEYKDLADIQSMINVSSSGSELLRQLDQPMTSMASSTEQLYSRDEEEQQDAFTAEFRKMKLRGEFPCKLCTAVFPNLRALKGHNRIHLTAAGSGPFRCNMCPYSIHDKAALIRHMRTHNGDRPYECAICNYAFTTKANCERHLRNRHGKSTRDEVKRAIIYHPSEDSSCDDPVKKMQIFNLSFEEDEERPPQDCSTPVSQLDDSANSDKIAKIQVKSIDQLTQYTNQINNASDENEIETNQQPQDSKPIDLSMDVLDLSKKSSNDILGASDLSIFEKNQQLILAQHKLFSEAFPQIDPAHYFQLQQLYRNLVFPTTGLPLHPFFLQNQLLAQLPTPNFNGIKNIIKNDILLTPTNNVYPNSMFINPIFPTPPNMPQTNYSASTLLQEALKQESPIQRSISPTRVPLPLTPQTPRSSRAHMVQKPQQSQQPRLSSPGPVKMVIKNGVLMPKQKQRRYRTERPFACGHCSARFTLRSNMERHIKQQHPQYWAQRQRNGHSFTRRNSSSSLTPSSTTMQTQSDLSSFQHTNIIDNTNAFNAISDQVKFAILAQQLKCRSDKADFDSMEHQEETDDGDFKDDIDEPKLFIDEEQHQLQDYLDKSDEQSLQSENNAVAKKIAKNILLQAMNVETPNENFDGAKPTSAHSETNESHKESNQDQTKPVSKKLIEGRSRGSSKDEGDLVSISTLVDNATNSVGLNKFFHSDSQSNEHSDEEGLVASGSTSESNNSGPEDLISNPTEGKKKSAYSLAPNRVSCPYCQRMFPWSSSLRRHILTHTGQKPFKCSQCPLLFTTKSNCDRHLLRKHGDVDSAVSLYVPIDEEIPEPIKKPASECTTSLATNLTISNQPMLPQIQLNIPQIKNENPAQANQHADLPFKCHLCDGSFQDRFSCLDHIKVYHSQEFALLVSKGAIEPEEDAHTISAEDDEKHGENGNRGKYPDYANRKVICAFCVRRFWSTEDLRRHMRTHSGERPFSCPVCMRKFTLKHSMLRHQKKHAHNVNSNNAQSASDISDDEQQFSRTPPSKIAFENVASLTDALVKKQNLTELITKKFLMNKILGETIDLDRKKLNIESGKTESEETSELIGNLLGISDSSILNKVLLSSADEAAKLLGVDK